MVQAASLFFALLFVAVAGSSFAQTERREGHEPPVIRVSAEAVVTARPDQAQMEIGVVSQADTAAAAAAQNATRLDAALAELKKIVGDRGEIRTLSYSVTPNYRYPRDGRPTIAGYTVTNVVSVRTGDLPSVARLIDAVTQSGANTIQRLAFTLKDETRAQADALRQASAAARAKAEAIASGLGLRIIRILRVEESGTPVRPMLEQRTFMAARAEAAPPTPVEPGTVELRASVILTVEVAPQ